MIGRWAHAFVAMVLLAGGNAGMAGCERRLGHSPVCGDGLVESPETCDEDCPTDCDDNDECTADVLSGSSGTCDVRCANDPIVTCVSGDGCCPGDCNALNDADCTPLCGNGIVEPPETCDGDCPANCDDGDACTVDTQNGSSDTCDVHCAHEPIATCAGGDGCCPGGGQDDCNALNDSDCAPLCGNDVPEPPEECDDGSTIGGDGCGATCLFEVCGNGYRDVDEACDDGNTTDGDGCSADCQSDESCGNGVLDVVTGEECDDGSTIGGDGCSAGCTIEVCGNGIQDVGEECDDGNTSDGDGCSASCLSDETCGNDVTDVVTGEECDDGNGVDWDGCTACAITEFQVNTYTSGSQHAPAVAVAPDGSFVVVWESWGGQDGHWTGVFGQRYDTSGDSVGGEFQVNTHTQYDQDRPKVAMAPDGRFVVVWTSTLQDGSGTGSHGQLYDSSGSPSGNEFQLNTYTPENQWFPDVAIAANGNFIASWTSDSSLPENGQDGSAAGVFSQDFDGNGSTVGVEFQVNTHTDGDQRGSKVAVSADGTVLVAWRSDNTDVSHTGYFGQLYNSSSTAVGGEFQIVFEGLPEIPAGMNIAMGPDGRFVMVRGGPTIQARTYSIAGAPTSPHFQVDDMFVGGSRCCPVAAVAADGSFVVVWESWYQDGSEGGIFARLYDSSGFPLGGEIQVNTYTNDMQIRPAVTMTPDGSFIVAWSSNGQDGNLGGIFAQRYDAQGNPLGRGP